LYNIICKFPLFCNKTTQFSLPQLQKPRSTRPRGEKTLFSSNLPSEGEERKYNHHPAMKGKGPFITNLNH
ncbi:MAG: hypothetical protein ACOCQD_05430, partial [archaeon]